MKASEDGFIEGPELSPERVLKGALAAKLDPVVVIGYDKNEELYVAATSGDIGFVNLMLDLAKKFLLKRLD